MKVALDSAGRPNPVYPEIRPGEPLVGLDFRQVPLPGERERSRRYDNKSFYEATNDGIGFTTANELVTYLAQPYLQLRDGCVRVSVVTHDPYLEVRAFARMQTVGDARVRYELVVRPTERELCIARNCAGGPDEPSDATRLVPWTSHAAIAPHGYVNVLELRFAGATLQGWVNGQYVAVAHDAALGTGQVGACITTSRKLSPGEMRRALFMWFDVRTVVA